MQAEIIISEAAKHYIEKMIAKENGIGFRVSVKKTGCSGYSYVPSIVVEVNPKDVALEIHGLPIYIDAGWESLLQQLHIDYVEENKSGINQKRLVFTNPKESSRCGCGESFHVE